MKKSAKRSAMSATRKVATKKTSVRRSKKATASAPTKAEALEATERHRKQNQSLKKKLAANVKQIEDIEADRDRYRRSLAKQRGANAKLSSKVEALSGDLETSRSREVDLQRQIDELAARCRDLSLRYTRAAEQALGATTVQTSDQLATVSERHARLEHQGGLTT